MTLALFLIALAGPGPQSIDQPRKNYAACIKRFESQSLKAKMELSAYTEAIKTACPAEAAALTKALVDYDVSMGSRRATAVANAATDVADYSATSLERYQMTVEASKPK